MGTSPDQSFSPRPRNTRPGIKNGQTDFGRSICCPALKMLHAALLLLMLEAVTTDLVSTISLKRRTQYLQLSNKLSADYPSLTFLDIPVCPPSGGDGIDASPRRGRHRQLATPAHQHPHRQDIATLMEAIGRLIETFF
jgi:hypothetical protein